METLHICVTPSHCVRGRARGEEGENEGTSRKGAKVGKWRGTGKR